MTRTFDRASRSFRNGTKRGHSPIHPSHYTCKKVIRERRADEPNEDLVVTPVERVSDVTATR